MLVRWKRVAATSLGAVSAVEGAAADLRRRDPEEATRIERRASELTGSEQSSEFTAAYVVDRTFPLPLAPSSVEYQVLPASSLRMSQGGSVLQKSVSRRVDVTASGEAGTRYRLGIDRDGVPLYQPGHVLHREFVAFLVDYLKGPATGADYRLTWHDLQHGRQYWVEPAAISDGWDADHPIGPRWSVTLNGYEATGYPNAGLGMVLSIVPQIRDTLQTVDRWANSVAAAAAVAEVAIEGIGDVLHGLGDVLDAVPRAVEAAAAMLADVNAIERYPFEFWRDLSVDVGAAVDRINTVLNGFDLLSTDRADQILTYRQPLRDLQRSLEVAAWAAQSASLGDDDTPSMQYTVRPGDTLQGIAARLLGDVGRWHEIAALNGLSPPFVSLSGVPGTAGPGDKILVPYVAGGAQEQVQSAGSGASDDLAFGVDFGVDANGRGSVEPGQYPADVRYSRGVACVGQGLSLTFRTVQGTDRFQPWFGMPLAVGDPSYGSAGLALVQIVDQILIDDRISAVRREAVTESGTAISVSCDVHLRDGRRLAGVTSTVGEGT